MSMIRRSMSVLAVVLLATAAAVVGPATVAQAAPVTPQAFNWYKIKNAGSNKYLGVSGSSPDDNARVVQWAASGNPDQLWYFQGGDSFMNGTNWKYLSIQGSSTAALAPALQYRWVGSADQYWELDIEGFEPSYRLRNARTGPDMCLGVADRSVQNGAQVVQYWCDGSANQRWQFEFYAD